MDQATSSVRETAAFARRVVLRTLTVVGGAAAGTAVAWCLSTTGASAETAPTTADLPVVTTVTDTVHAVVVDVRDNPHATPPPKNPLEEFGEQVGEQVKAAADRFGERAKDRVGQLPQCAVTLCGELGDLGGLGRGDYSGADTGLGRSDTPATSPAAAPPAVAAGAVTTAGVDPDRTAEHTATGRAYADGMSRRGSPAPAAPSSPDFPIWPTPFAPAVPTAPASGHSGFTTNPADSSLFAALPWQDRATALVRGLTVPATVATTFGRVGAQPGVSPD